MAEYVHNRGLRFGIHIMRGIPRRAVRANLPVHGTLFKATEIADQNSTCRWTGDIYGIDMIKPGAQAYYEGLVKQYASWGVDYIKADDMVTPFHGPEIWALHSAIQHSGRPIVLSLSPGPADLSKASFYAQDANLWRISDDFRDKWDALRKNFVLLGRSAPLSKPGGWPDADMLPLGRIGMRAERGDDRHTRFTRDEQRTMMTLWCIARSPLIFGGGLPSNDADKLALISNREVLEVDQNSTANSQLFSRGNQVVWVADAPDRKSRYL